MGEQLHGWCHYPLLPSVSGCTVVVVMLKMVLLLRALCSRQGGGENSVTGIRVHGDMFVRALLVAKEGNIT